MAASLSLVLLVFLGHFAAGQNTTAVCLTGFEWMFNTLGQSPCIVASYLQGACLDGTYNIPALVSGHHYTGPDLKGSNATSRSRPTACTCSTVVYSLVAGCGACQGVLEANEASWSDWIVNCTKTGTDVSVGSFKHSFSNQTQIPPWAYVDVIPSDSFKLESARLLADQAAQLSSSSISTVTNPTSASDSATSTTVPSPDNAASNAPSVSTAHRTGGSLAAEVAVPLVVVLLIGLIAGAIVWERRRRSRRHEPLFDGASVPYTAVPGQDDISLHERSEWSSTSSAKGRTIMASESARENRIPDREEELAALDSAMQRAGLSVDTLIASLPRGHDAIERPPQYDE